MLRVPSKAKKLVEKRLKRLEQAIAPLAEYVESRPLHYQNKQRLVDANAYFQEALAIFNDLTIENYSSWRKQVYKAIIHAQVEVDTIYNPEVDPVNGWVKQDLIDVDEDGNQELRLDTQLMTLLFKPELSGGLVDFEYKPRKVNLVNYSSEWGEALGCLDYFFEEDLTLLDFEQIRKISQTNAKAARVVNAEYLNTKHSLDLAGFRFVKELGSSSAKLIKHFNFKAGIGAYLPNCTTGFSIEYWLESDSEISDNFLLVNQFAFLYPLATEHGMLLRTLGSFGGFSEKAIDASIPQLFKSAEVAGGLHGLRMIDGLSNFVMDIRSAKPLQGALVYPLFDSDQNLLTMIIQFYIKAKSVSNDDKANMIFISIM